MKSILIVLALLCENAFAFDLSAGTFEIFHNRSDLKIERLWIQAACFNPDGTSSNLEGCAKVSVDGKPNGEGFIEFLAATDDITQIKTNNISFRYQQKSGKFFCVGLKVLFDGFPSQCDEVLYNDIKDRYSILSFCTIDELPENTPASARFSNRRLNTWNDFSSAFSQPVRLQLTSSGRPDWCDSKLFN